MGIDYNNVIVTDGLAVYLDAANSRSYSGSGNTWYNLISGAIGGTIVGVGYSTLSGGYFNFTGSQYMTFASTPPIGQSTLSSTVEIISYRNSAGPFEVMLGGGPYSLNQSYWFGHRANNNNFMMAHWANDSDSATPTTNIAWNQYIAVFDNSIGRRATYYNSAILNNEASGVNNTSNSSYFLGAYRESGGSPQYHYSGRIASLKIYNRVLSQAEITQNYNAMKARYR